ncbi:putative reverse transcriptase domain-containing protein, partial [Tanacetum coccineum]
MLNNLSRCAFNAPGLIIPLRPNLGVLQIGIRAKVIENQGADEELSDRGSPRVIVYGYDGLPMQPVAPPSPDYVPGPKHPPSPDYVPGPEHPPSPVEPLPADASPTTLSPGYVTNFDLDEDPEEDPEEDHADYPADGGDDDDEPSDDDDDDDDTDDEDKEPFKDEVGDEEEEDLALADLLLYCCDLTRLRRVQKIVRLEPPMPPSMEARIAEYATAIPPPSPLTPLSSPLPHIPSPPLPPPPSLIHLPPPVPTLLPLPSSPLPPLPALLFILPPVDHKEDILEAELPPRKRLCPTAPTSRYKVGESSTTAPKPIGGHRAEYGFIGTMNAEIRRQRAEEEQDTHDIYAVIEDTQDRQTQLFQRVDGLVKDRQTHTQMQDYRIASQESLLMTLIAQVSSLQGQLSAALGQIQALQARDQTHVDDPEGAASMANNMPPRRTSAATARAAAAAAAAPMTAAAVEQLIEARVSEALANHETLQNSTNGHGDGSHNSDTVIRGTVRTPREYTYKDFLNCQPLTFKGTEGVVVLSQWFEKMESMFHISNCARENQVKFATCTFLGNALTWWNSHMKAITQDVAYAMDWKTLKKTMTDKYCPRGEIKKLESELWNLKVKGTDVGSYTLRFQELALMCGRMFPEESDEVQKYV